MIGSVTKSSTGKKILSIFVAIAMVLTMSNISAYYASAADAESGEAAAEDQTITEGTITGVDGDTESTPGDNGTGTDDPEGDGNGENDGTENPGGTQEPGDNQEPGGTQEPGDNQEPGVTPEPGNTPEGDEVVQDPNPPIEETVMLTVKTYKDGVASTQSFSGSGYEEGDTVTVESDDLRKIGYSRLDGADGPLADEQVISVPVTLGPVEQNDTTNTVCFYYTSFYSYSVIYDLGEAVKVKADEGIAEFNTEASSLVDIPPTYTYDDKHYALVTTDSFDKISVNAQDNVVTAHYAVDELLGNDGIADIYQTEVVYKIENGTWADGTTEDVSAVATFMKDNAPSDAANAVATPELPVVGSPSNEFCKDTGSWSATTIKKSEVIAGYPVWLTYKFDTTDDAHELEIVINYHKDNARFNIGSHVWQGPKGEALSVDVNKSMVNENYFKNGAFDYATWTNAATNEVEPFVYGTKVLPATADSAKYYIDVYFDVDNIGPNGAPDGVADKYQQVIEYVISNGRIVKGNKTEVVTLTDLNGNFNENGSALVTLPTIEPYNGYSVQENSKWEGPLSISNNKTRVYKSANGEPVVFTYNFEAAPQNYAVYIRDMNDNPIPGIEDDFSKGANYGDEIALSEVIIDIDGYVFYMANKTSLVLTTDPNVNEFTLFYAPDEDRDGIADMYQATVTYEAVNGTVSGNTSVRVTLVDANGNPAVNGSYVLKASDIPTFAANAGYRGGTWSPTQPTTSTVITGDTHFRVTYSAIPEVDDSDDYESDDNTGNRPAANNQNNTNNVVAGPIAGAVAADNADEATEEVTEEVIDNDENPLVAPEDEPEQTIADDENALADYEEATFNWIPYIVIGMIVLAGALFFIWARRRSSEEENAA